ncbi:MAG: GNAT family N-acetyltransferase [Anaerolineae bacterium]
MEIRIRGGTPEDAEGIANVLNEIILERTYSSLSEPFSVEAEREFIASMDERAAIFVAEADGEIIGFQTIEPFANYSRALAHVGVVGTFVLEEFRRQGIGRRLFYKSLEFASLMGYEKIIAYVRRTNELAQNFYSKMGFTPIGVLEKQVKINGQYDDQIVMEMFIPPETEIQAWVAVPWEAEMAAPAVPVPVVEEAAPVPAKRLPEVEKAPPAPRPMVIVRRAKRSDLDIIAGIINTSRKDKPPLNEQEILERFGKKGYWLSFSTRAAAVAGWQAENLVGCIDEFYIYPAKYLEEVGAPLLEAVEKAAVELQCEAAILFPDEAVSPQVLEFYRRCGYEPRELDELHRYWREVAAEFLEPGKRLLVKQLRESLVTRPI